MKTLERAICFLLTLLILLGGVGTAFAANERAAIVFRAEEASGEGMIDIFMTVYNASFNVFQFALLFDPEVVKPVDAAGRATDDAAAYLRIAPGATELASIGLGLNVDAGYFTFAGFVAPGQNGRGRVDENGCLKADDTGTDVFVFRFLRVGAGDFTLTIASPEAGGVYNEALPEGATLLGAFGDIPFTVALELPPAIGVGGEVYVPQRPTVPKPTSMTREERIKDTILLPVGGAQAVVGGTLASIYPGEPGVTAYAHDNRTFVPVRFVAERLGAEVGWDNETQTVFITKGGRTIAMTVGETEYTIDGEPYAMDVPAEYLRDPGTANARTMVPVRFVAEALSMNVIWDSISNLVIISPENAPWNLNNRLEQELMSDALLILSPFIQNLLP